MNPFVRLTITLFTCCSPFAPPARAQDHADLVLRNGTIATLDDAHPRATALAARDGRILLVGTDAQADALVGPRTRIIDLAGRFAMPGFVESHGHFMMLGESKLSLDLSSAKNWDDVVARVAAAAKNAKPGDWITGTGWHQEKWSPRPAETVDGVPTHHALSAVTPDNPVALSHASGHASFANAKAMQLAGITPDTPDPAGGAIVRDPDRQPTGYLRENASSLLWRAHARADAARPPAERLAEQRKIASLAAEEALRHGITTFHDAGAPFATIDLFRQLADERALPLRLYVMVRDDNRALRQNLAAYRTVGYGDGMLTVRAIKRSIDGALGAHGAWLAEPYADLPSSTGNNTSTIESIRETAELAIAHGYQLCTHAIGDRANREILDLYAATFAAHPDRRDLRWRIEHAQHVDPRDLPRFRSLGVIASMQAVHATSDGPWIVKRLGERRARDQSYVWRSLLDAGVVVANGTDTPVEPIDPIPGIHASVTRLMPSGQPLFPEQRMTRPEALRSYTTAGAFAAFEENDKGTLAPGKLADIVVLSHDLLATPDPDLRSAKVHLTIVAGKIAYPRPQ
jgi:predicted amidohydrolase YtcJ